MTITGCRVFLLGIKEKKMPEELTYTEAKKIVDETEIINEGTDHAFPKGCFGDRYFNACKRMSLTWLDKELRV